VLPFLFILFIVADSHHAGEEHADADDEDEDEEKKRFHIFSSHSHKYTNIADSQVERRNSHKSSVQDFYSVRK
jgi:hypothetical protein